MLWRISPDGVLRPNSQHRGSLTRFSVPLIPNTLDRHVAVQPGQRQLEPGSQNRKHQHGGELGGMPRMHV